MQDIDLSIATFERNTANGNQVAIVRQDIDPENMIMNRYLVRLTNSDITFSMDMDENGCWNHGDLPNGLDEEFVVWVGSEIERYYK